MANLITLGRLVLFFMTVALLYTRSLRLVLLTVALVILVIWSDALDGWVARYRGSATDIGSVIDIAGDRIVETCFWIVFADLGLIGVWAPLLVVTRGIVVDTLRAVAFSQGRTAFGDKSMATSALTAWLTASRFMRGLYGAAKAAGFVFLTATFAARLPEAYGSPAASLLLKPPLWWLGWLLVYLALALTVIRGLPVVFDAWNYLSRPAA